jgi:hypothetical protein
MGLSQNQMSQIWSPMKNTLLAALILTSLSPLHAVDATATKNTASPLFQEQMLSVLRSPEDELCGFHDHRLCSIEGPVVDDLLGGVRLSSFLSHGGSAREPHRATRWQGRPSLFDPVQGGGVGSTSMETRESQDCQSLE